MANDLSITQNLRQLTLTLPADSVTVAIDVKTLRGQYTFCLNNNYTDLSFNPWSKDHEPSESFQKIVRETQIEPNSHYLETVMRQSLYSNFGLNNNRPIVNTVQHNVPQTQPESPRYSPCPSNWSDDLLRVNYDAEFENPEQTDPPTENDTDQPTMSTGTRVPQDLSAQPNTVMRLPHSAPKTLPKTQKPKTRPPYATWAIVKPKRQMQTDTERNQGLDNGI